MRIAAIALGAAALASGAAHAADIEIRDVVARVVVIPESRGDVKVEFVRTNAALPLKLRTSGGRTIVEGDVKRGPRSCDGEGERAVVRLDGGRAIRYADMPQIVIRAPRDLNLSADGAIYGAVGRTEALELGSAGCGDWTLGNVVGPLRISSAGAGGIRAGSAGDTTLRLAGSGDISVGAVRSLSVDLAGSGDIDVRSAAGPIDIKVAGSGDVGIDKGEAAAMSVMLAGSGDVSFGGVAGSLNATILGSGDVRAARVTGEVRRRVMGSGSVRVGS